VRQPRDEDDVGVRLNKKRQLALPHATCAAQRHAWPLRRPVERGPLPVPASPAARHFWLSG